MRSKIVLCSIAAGGGITVAVLAMLFGAGRHVRDGIKQAAEEVVDETPHRVLGDLGKQAAGALGGGADAIDNIDETAGHAVAVIADAIRRGGKQIDAQVLDTLGISPELESELGRALHEQAVATEFTLLRDERAERELAALAEPLIKQTKRPGVPYQFFIVDSPDVNAFSHLGGYVYVNRGLIDLLKTRVELQFVLGHEIAHIELKHVLRGPAYIQLAGGVPLPPELLATALGFARCHIDQEDEFECDEWSYRALRAMKIPKPAILSAPRRIAVYFEQKGTESKPPPAGETIVDTVARELDSHFRTHPHQAERIRRLEAMD